MPTMGAGTSTNQVLQGASSQRHNGGSSQQLSWSSLHADLLNLIADRVIATDLLDYVRFRAVCVGWRDSTPCPHGHGVVDPRFHPRQWMMFPEGSGLQPGHAALGGYVRFFNVSTGAFVRVHLPCLENHSVLDCPEGLLLLEHEKDSAMCLLHPFTGDVAEFPPLSSLIQQLIKVHFNKGQNTAQLRCGLFNIFAAISVRVDHTVTVMLAISNVGHVAYASTGDRQWTLASWEMSGMWTAVPFHGSFYVVREWKRNPSIMRIDPPDGSSPSFWSSTPPQKVATCPTEQMTKPYLVVCNSELILVGYADKHSRLVALRLADLLFGVSAVPLMSIGDNALFIGPRNMTVNSKNLPCVQGNSITILTTSGSDGQLLQYDLAKGTRSVVCDGNFLKFSWPIPRPYSLVHHIVTCCHRLFWSSGHIWCDNETEVYMQWGARARARVPVSLYLHLLQVHDGRNF
ncbi:uncharacterized protein [Lolium perenne]|uniref:uncharacterized protein n=1 Tax=Lolium perenne TaxID=4522 RepID=UPI0021F5DB23|nr:uncharacterized protein LOC127300043 [Lolium perenne]